MADTRKTYRINKDMWTELVDILVGTPDEFNEDLSKRYDWRSEMDKYSGTLRGRNFNPDTMGTGVLGGNYLNEFIKASKEGRIEFVIYSYETPIAWRALNPNGDEAINQDGVGYSRYHWVMPDVKYSVTTSKHQAKVRVALSQISGGI